MTHFNSTLADTFDCTEPQRKDPSNIPKNFHSIVVLISTPFFSNILMKVIGGLKFSLSILLTIYHELRLVFEWIYLAQDRTR